MNDRRGHASVPVAAPLLALLAIALGVAACQTTPSTTATFVPASPAPTAAPTIDVTVAPPTLAPTAAPPTTAPSSAAGAPSCRAADLKASHGITDGAAGSLFTEVVLVSNSACSVDAFPALGLRDSAGGALVGGASGGPGRIDLVPGNGYTSNVRLSNWCAPDPSFPLELELIVGGEELAVTGGSFPDDGLPPCNGEGGPILEGSEWISQLVIL